MKYIRKFNSTQERDVALANVNFDVLAGVVSGDTITIEMHEGTPVVDYSIPFYIDVRGSVTLAATSGLQMSTDGTTWTDTVATTLSSGKTYFRVASDQSTPLKPNWTENSSSDYDIGGNINSLAKVNFENDNTCYSFYDAYIEVGFFQGKTKLKSAGDLILPATTLADGCYYYMFYGCTSLTTAPVLPATTLATECYGWMFMRCTSLTTAPALPATTLAQSCYAGMFRECTALTTAPSILPVTTLANGCYNQMFYGCTSLTTAPELPATTLTYSCYESMFSGCTSLTTAPVLPATTLLEDCYYHMFYGCTSLNSVTSYANNISTDCLSNWLYNVAATGDFYNLGTATYESGASGIPVGWTEHTSL